jgi:monofunctional biosynthetic peptidoglycan transglycosylase
VIVLIVVFRWVPVPFTSFMIQDRTAALFSSEKGYRYAHDWVPLTKISKNLQRAVIASEDQLFAEHFGFDFQQIKKAIDERERPQKKGAKARKRRVRGASTISQQVAKNLFLWSGQSFIRKGLEAVITLIIELTWPKERILEVYLNSAEFGRGTWGAEAAAQKFFKKTAARLTPQEAALLAVSLPNPKKMRVDKPSAYMQKRQKWVLTQMYRVQSPETGK